MEKLHIGRAEVYEFTKQACAGHGLDTAFFEQFWERLSENDDIYKEYVWYLVKREFIGEVVIGGFRVIDVLIWQMDHFKARMDTDTYAMRHDEARMVLSAFDTFLRMREAPEAYIARMQTDTGTDYPDKY